MNKTVRWLATALVAAASTVSATAHAQNIAVGNQNTFESGTTEGWLINLLGMGGPVPQPEVITTGGPAGAGDAYLRLTATGRGGPGGRLVGLTSRRRGRATTSPPASAPSRSTRTTSGRRTSRCG